MIKYSWCIQITKNKTISIKQKTFSEGILGYFRAFSIVF